MRYEEFPPPAELRSHLRCAWIFEASAAEATAAPQRIVPDGRCELVVHLGDPFEESGADGQRRLQARVLFAGQLSRPLWLHATGRAHVIGARFHCGAARAFLGMPVASATDRRLDLASLWSLPPLESLADVLRFVASRVAASDEGDPPIEECAAWLEREQGRVEIEALVAATGVGRRQLERRFRDAVGLSPRLFANVLRLRSVFDALEANPAAGWSDAALAAGYFDQSHLIRDFRRFVGCTPAQFVASARGLEKALVD